MFVKLYLLRNVKLLFPLPLKGIKTELNFIHFNSTEYNFCNNIAQNNFDDDYDVFINYLSFSALLDFVISTLKQFRFYNVQRTLYLYNYKFMMLDRRQLPVSR